MRSEFFYVILTSQLSFRWEYSHSLWISQPSYRIRIRRKYEQGFTGTFTNMTYVGCRLVISAEYIPKSVMNHVTVWFSEGELRKIQEQLLGIHSNQLLLNHYEGSGIDS